MFRIIGLILCMVALVWIFTNHIPDSMTKPFATPYDEWLCFGCFVLGIFVLRAFAGEVAGAMGYTVRSSSKG